MNETVGMILCGGFGKRLRPVTETIPKPLVELRENYTILDKQIFDFKSAGINKVFLLTGFLGEKIEERYGNNYMDVEIEYIKEEKPLGTLNAIRLGMEQLDDDVQCVIRNGDVVADLSIKKMVEDGEKSPFDFNIFITQMKSPYGIVELSGDRITSFKEKPLLDYYINGGIYFSKGNLDFGNYKTGDIEKTIFPELAKEKKLGYYKENGLFWMAVDTTKELQQVQDEYSNREDKPWGYEKVLIYTEKYLTKELFLKEGYQTSFHYHPKKDETMYIVSGKGYIEFEDKKEYFGAKDTIRIEPNTPHTIVAIENTVLHEVSTPDIEDTVRIKDYYAKQTPSGDR